MALVPDQKFSTFQNGGTPTTGDIVVGLRAGINTRFNWTLPATVDTITGTDNQVLVNGSFGTPVAGDVTLTTPQDIGTTSYPTFAGLTLTSIPLDETSGGTAQSTYTLGDILYSSAANTLSKLAGNTTAVKQYLSQTGSGAVSAAPAWATISGGDITGAALTKVDDTNVTLTLGGTPSTALLRATSLTLGWTGQLGLNRGGSNASLTASNGGIVYSTATAMAILAGTVTAGQILQSGSSAAPSWSTSTYPATNAINTLLYASSANTMAALATVNRASLSTTSTGVPTWLALTDGQLIIGSTAGSPAAASLTAGSGISITPGSNSISIAATSGSGSPLTTKGDLYTFSTVNDRLAVGITNGQMLQVNSATSTGLAWSTSTFPTTATSTGTILRANGTNWVPSTSTFADTYAASTLLYSNGANAVTGLATANSSVLITNSTGVPAMSGALANGQFIIGSTGATPVVANLTAGPGVSIANGAGSITISGTGSGTGFTEVTGTSQAMVADAGYVSNNAGLVTFTLPVTAAFGTSQTVVGLGAGGWKINQNSGQNIQVGNQTTTVGVGGSLASANRYDSIDLLCVVANTTWVAWGAPQSSGLTFV